MKNGTVKFFDSQRGFGFITPDDGAKDVFVHISALQSAGIETVVEGQQLTFSVEQDARGRFNATGLQAA
ncbi:cold-shock protein [uncultured Roseibium sp.]|uniref:cold-shock protein n=1 Tax=uncultured Roseibium sp. TaxID=1936171 RepID=UPI0037484E1C